MKLIDIVPVEGKSEDILFGPRLIALGIFKPNAKLPTGFGLRVRRASGGRIMHGWILQYRVGGAQRRMNFANALVLPPPQALTKALKLAAQIELGGDPQGARHERREKDAAKLRKLVTDYLKAKSASLRPNSLRAVKHYLELTLKPLHGMAVDTVARKDISKIMLDVSQKSGAASAAGFRAALSAMFGWAMQMGLAESNPVIGSFNPPRAEDGDRVLTGEELAAIWNALEDDDYARIVRLLICSGCRREEIGRMAWAEFDDPVTPTKWTLPKERAKNHRALTLPLSPLMRDVIASVPRVVGVDYLFGGSKGFTQWHMRRRALDQKLTLKPWRVHDIRRSVATGMADLGIMPHIIEAILNHVSGHKGGVAGIYNRSRYESQVFEAMQMWSDHIRSLIEGGKSKVRTFESARQRA
jgi:integrase